MGGKMSRQRQMGGCKMKDWFKFKAGSNDIGYVGTALCTLTGIAIGIIAAVRFYKAGGDVSSMAALAGVFIGVGVTGHVANNISQNTSGRQGD